MSDLKLYNYYRSSTSYRVRIALELKKLKYTYIPIHLLNNNGEQNSTSYRELNPMGGVPTLVHNGRTLAQSLPIIEYIDEVFNTINPLFSKDVYLKAKIKQACEIINADLHPLQNLKVTQYLENELNVTELQKNLWLQKWIKEGLAAFEKTITEYAGVFCFGESVSAADLFLIPQLVTAKRFQIDFSEFKILNKINNHCLELEAFNKAHPFKQIDTPNELRTY